MNSTSVVKFIYENIITHHICLIKIVVDGGPENKAHVAEFVRRYRI